MRALDADGNPVADATPGIRHEGAGIGESYMSTRSDGYAYINDGDTDGVELTDRVQLNMEIPTDGGAFKLEERVRIDSPTEVVFQIGDGVSVSTADGDATSTATQTRTETRTQTPTQTQMETATATTEPRTATTTADGATASRTATSSRAATGTATPPSRGFISNGDSATDLGPLDDPFVLTVGGFALSVAGIVHQMVRGY